MSSALKYLIFIVVLVKISAVYFLVSSERKCFTIEQPRDTPILFSYQILDKGHEISFTTYYGALSNPDLQISEEILDEPVGHEELLTDNDGYYSVCLQQEGTQPFPTRFQLDINYGRDTEYYEKLAKEMKLDPINLEVHKLNDMMTVTLNEADYMKHKEVEYHEQTEQMDTATLWWPVIQVNISFIKALSFHNLFHVSLFIAIVAFVDWYSRYHTHISSTKPQEFLQNK